MNRSITTLTAAAACLLATAAQARESTRTTAVSAPTRAATAPSATGTTGASTASVAPIAIAPGQGISFAQTAFVDAEGVEHLTGDGVVEIDAQRLARVTGLSGGYVHIVTPDGAGKHNIAVESDAASQWPEHFARLRIKSDGVLPPMQVPFALGQASETGVFMAQVIFTADPIFKRADYHQALEHAPLTSFPLLLLAEAVGGMGMGSYGQLPPVGDPGPSEQGEYQVSWGVMLPNVTTANVETAFNQCAPSGLANALQFIERTYGASGYSFPEPHVRGMAGSNSLVGALETLVGRSFTNTCVGNGSGRCPGGPGGSSSIDGLFQYLQTNDPQRRIAVNHQGGDVNYPNDCAQLANVNYDRASIRQGALPTWSWICDRVVDGDSVLLNVGFYNNVGGKTGGHVVRAYGCGQVGDQKYLWVSDDGQQDGMADVDNDGLAETCLPRAGLRYRQMTATDSDNDGMLDLGGAGTEVEMAWALSPDLN